MSNLAMIHQNRQLNNFGKRSGIISYKGVMTPDKKEEMKKTIKAMGTGEDTGGRYRDWETDRKSTRLNSSHSAKSRMPSSA